MNVDHRSQYHLGLLLVASSAVAWSTAGFFTRLIQVDAWTILFWRGIFSGLFIVAFAIWQMKGETFRVIRSMDRHGWLITACSTIGMIAFIPALKLTSVANVVIIYATVPFVAAALAWLWFKESSSNKTLLASAIALCGVGVMVGGSSMNGSHWGDFLAFVMTFNMAVMMVMIRRYQTIPLLPMAFLSNFLCSAVIWPFAAPYSVGPVDIGYLALFGLVQMTLGLTLLSMGSRLIPPAQAGLISALETPLAPLWVWLAFGETPLPATLIGGVIVMIAVVGHIVAEHYRLLQIFPTSEQIGNSTPECSKKSLVRLLLAGQRLR